VFDDSHHDFEMSLAFSDFHPICRSDKEIRTLPKGFTLIEMLVTVAIIALLAAVLFSAVRSGIAAAKAAGCVSNLRQNYVAFTAYAQDNAGDLPLNSDPSVPGNNPWWMSYIAPYLGEPTWQTPYVGGKTLKCPAYPTTPQWQTYTINSYLYSASTGIRKIIQARRATETILLYDGYDGGVFGDYSGVRWNSHPGGANFLLLDGSVSTFSQQSEAFTNPTGPFWIPSR
jgi:prepilin-type N-terminal cleavage/methylation domain-containing protein/prepilin-type processing-associated H-X9-DG protein